MTAKRDLVDETETTTLGLEGAAKVMRLGVEAMKDLVNQGTVPAVRLNQKHTVLLREDLIDFLRQEGRKQAAARREAVGRRQAANTPVEPQKARPGKPRRATRPNLDAYDIKS